MPAATPLIKVTRTKEYGAEVVLHGANYDEAFDEARRRREAEGLTFIHPFDDDAVIAGQGTIGLELLEQNPYLEAVVVPIGGGGLISGIAVRDEGDQPAHPHHRRADGAAAVDGARRLAEHAPVTLPAAVTHRRRHRGAAARASARCRWWPSTSTRSSPSTRRRSPTPSCCCSSARRRWPRAPARRRWRRCCKGAPPCTGKKVAVVIGGGNIDVNMLSRIIERGLVKDGRLVRFRVRIPDHPGGLHKLTGEIAVGARQHPRGACTTAPSRASIWARRPSTSRWRRAAPSTSSSSCEVFRERGYEHERLF